MATHQIDSLLEREAAISAIDDVIACAGRREGSVALVEAVAGLGKTTLLSAAHERAMAAGFHVASAVGAELERDFSFGVVRQLFERKLAHSTAGERREVLSGPAHLAAPVLGVTLGYPELAKPAEGGQRAVAATHGLYWLVANLAERGPLIVIVDDAHLADMASLRWLRYLVRRLEGLSVAVLVATRPGEERADWQVLAGIAADPRTRTVRLAPLTRHGAAELVRRTLGGVADDEFCAACHLVSGGNPFLLRELLDELARHGVEPTAVAAPRVRELVPETVTRSVTLRMAHLPAAANAIARAVAILGSCASVRDAAALAELDEAGAARAADALAAAGILLPELPLRFVHPLLHAAVVSDLPAAERALWHARAARVIGAGGAGAERTAAHLLRAQPAGDPWVVARLRQASGEAMTRGDPRSAIALLRRAFVEPVPSEARIPLLQELLQAEFMAMDPNALEGLEAEPEREIAADPMALQQSALLLCLRLFFRGRHDEALAVLERAISTAEDAGDDDLALRLEARWITFAQLHPAEALRRLEPYDGRVEPGTFAGRLVNASLAWYGSFTGHSAAETTDRVRRAFADGRLVAELQDDDLVLATCVLALLLTDELQLAERVIAQILELGRARGSASAVASGSYLSAYLARQRGDLVLAEGDAHTAVRGFGEAGMIADLPPMTALLVDILVERGRLDDADGVLTSAGMDADVPATWWFAPVLWSRGKLRLAQGRARDGVDDLLELGRRADHAQLGGSLSHPWASLAAPALFQLGAHAEARRIAQRELREARAWGTPRAIGQALRGLGLVTQGPDGLTLLRDAVETLRSSPARLEEARALVDLGATLRRRNHRSAARDPLRTALDIAHRCGAQLLAERAIQELRATGAKPRKLVLTGIEALTASERRIAEMAAEGRTNREIAQALFVTIKTVDTHMTHVFQKLHLQSRRELRPLLADARPAAR